MEDESNCILQRQHFEQNIKTIWKNFQFDSDFCDVTLACKDGFIQTHRCILSTFSPVLRNILKLNKDHYPYIYLEGVKYKHLQDMLVFLYNGTVNIPTDDLNNVIEIAENLKITNILLESSKQSKSQKNQSVQNIISSPERKSYDNKKVDDENLKSSLSDLNTLCQDFHEDKELSYSTSDINADDSEKEKYVLESRQNNASLNITEDLTKNDKYCEDGFNLMVEGVKLGGAAIKTNKTLNLALDQHPIRNSKQNTEMFTKESEQNSKAASHNNSQTSEDISKNIQYNDNSGVRKCHKELKLKDLKYRFSSLDGRKLYICETCDKEFTSQSGIWTHVKTIHGGLCYDCDQCDYKANTKYHLRRHVQMVHQKLRYSCTKCEFTSSNKDFLGTHVRSIHKGVTYFCNKCEYKSTYKYSMTRHMKSIHDGVHYSCDQCQYKATLKSKVNKHVKLRHTNKLVQ